MIRVAFAKSAIIALIALANSNAREELPFMDPIPEPIEIGDLELHLELWATAPHSSSKAPRARINAMKPEPSGSGTNFINDQRGLLYRIENKRLIRFLDLRDYLPEFHDERGLGGGFNFFELHPGFGNNGLFYTVHTEELGPKKPDFMGPEHQNTNPIDSVVLEWTALEPRASTFEGSVRELLRVRFPRHIHCIQDLVFNPHAMPGDKDYGMLYIGIGEGGSMIAGQAGSLDRLDSILGTIIRIDPAGSNSANGNYGVPTDNPWADDSNEATLGELWAIGFRNPHRFAWGPEGRLYVTDIGESNIEELNLVEKGGRYGWPHREGTFELQLDRNKFGLLPLPGNDSGFTYPVAQFDHMDAAAISGGYVYQGNQHTLLRGLYVCGAIVQGHLFYTDASKLTLGRTAPFQKFRIFESGSETTMTQLTGPGRVDLRFGIDHQGELYIFEKNQGRIYQIEKVIQINEL